MLGKINATNSNNSDAGIPCYDNIGYIRNLFVPGNNFRPTSGKMLDRHRINITEIDTYGNKGAARYIEYINNMQFSGESEIDNDKKDGNNNDTELIVLRKGMSLFNSDNIGQPSHFFCPEHKPFCHLEVFMKDNKIIDELFSGKYILNAYKINPNKVYMKTDGADGTPAFQLLQLQEFNELPAELYDYQLKEYHEENGNVYYEFKYRDKKYYIKSTDKDMIAENLLNLQERGFEKYDNDKDDDIFCDDEVIADFDVKNKDVLRKYVCKFPFGWNSLLYAHCDDKDCTDCNNVIHNKCNNLPQKLFSKGYITSNFPVLSRIMERANVRNDIDFMQEETKPKVWHLHPFSLYEHYIKLLKTQSFNPYESTPKQTRSFRATTEGAWFPLEDWTVVFHDNPGFAPTVQNASNAIHGRKIEEHFFSNLFTSPFGILRRNPNGNHSRHTGIDLATGGRRTPVVALVQGIIWACSAVRENATFGKVMFIKGTGANDDKLYFLAHLDRFIEGKGELDTVIPGDEVAITGNTGQTSRNEDDLNSGIHLHLEVFKDISGNRESVLRLENIRNGTPRDQWLNLGNYNNNAMLFYRRHRVDPFDHSHQREL